MVSICILNWNCCDTLKPTILLLTEELKDIEYEIIVYDQASTDDSVNFLRSVQSDKVIPIFDTKNSGNSIARNIMINRSKYKYILLLDSDIIPIKNSIKNMIKFMENHPTYAYLGYDWKSYTTNSQNITTEEVGISDHDVANWEHKIALSQYGLFRKSVLEKFQFPEFEPFNAPGWGAEDDILGIAIFNNNLGLSGTIKNRVYFHNKGSSQHLLGKDDHQRIYMKRIIAFLFFRELLNVQQQNEALHTKQLTQITLNCNQYHWDPQSNLGDIATYYLLEKYFPFIQFNREEKNNLLMFGGTIFDHINNANKKYNAQFKNILYFGVGLSKPNEIPHAASMMKNHGIRYSIVPRGPKSAQEFRRFGFQCDSPCGDVLQLFAMMPKAQHNSSDPELLVHDIWQPYLIKPHTNNYTIIRVANNGSFPEIPYYNINQFLSALDSHSNIYSSQIHPILIASVLGKPCYLYQKDWRALDFSYFKGFNHNMSTSNSLELRSHAQTNIIKFCTQFYSKLKMFV